jgi:endonuclease YncB( thermonuclease family)
VSEGTDWTVERVVRVVDGDTVRLVRSRTTDLGDLELIARDRHDDGVSVRLVNLDTPERRAGQLEQWGRARDDLAFWLCDLPRTPPLRVITYPGGGFDRLLGDIYVEGDIGNTATQHMLRDRGWSPYMRGN